MQNLIAILPYFQKGRGIGTKIYYKDRIVEDKRSCQLILSTMLKNKCISKKEMKETVAFHCMKKRNLPWIIDTHTVLFPFNYQKSAFREGRRGYVNVVFVERIDKNVILLKNGEKISAITSQKALIDNFKNARLLLLTALVSEAYFKEEKDKLTKSIAKSHFLFYKKS